MESVDFSISESLFRRVIRKCFEFLGEVAPFRPICPSPPYLDRP